MSANIVKLKKYTEITLNYLQWFPQNALLERIVLVLVRSTNMSHSLSCCLGNTFENKMRGTLGNLECSSPGTQEHLNRKRSNWPPSIFSGYCAAGATFLEGAALFVPVQKRRKKKVVGKEKKKSLHQDFAHSLPAKATG